MYLISSFVPKHPFRLERRASLCFLILPRLSLSYRNDDFPRRQAIELHGSTSAALLQPLLCTSSALAHRFSPKLTQSLSPAGQRR